MLPFTTYNIPEGSKSKTHPSGKWLWILHPTGISVPQEELLHKIIQALKADIHTDVLLIEMPANDDKTMATIADDKPELIVSFDIAPSLFGVWIDIGKHGIRMLEKCTWIQSHSLEDLLQSPVAKKQLWSAMQLFLEKASADAK